MAISMYRVDSDHRLFWIHRLKSGQVSEPEWAYVPVEEKYNMNDPRNTLRELFGRHRCPACGKAFFSREASWNCHPAASAYKIWKKFAHTAPAGAGSVSELARAALSALSCGGYYGGPYGF